MKSIYLTLVLAFFFISCSMTKSIIDNEKDWVITQINGYDHNTNKMPFFSIKDGSISGNTGCNSFSGNLQTDTKGLFKVGALRTTRMLCPESMKLEDQFSSAMSKATHYKIGNGVLSIFDKHNKVLFTASQDKKILHNKWYLNSFRGFENTVDKMPFFSIKEGGISGNTGCNSFSANLQTNTKDLFEVGELRTTRMLCPESMKLEDQFSTALSKADHYKISNGILSVFDKNKKVLFTASKNKKILHNKWHVNSVKGFRNTSGKMPFFTIKNGNIEGNTSCNNFGGNIQTDAEGLFKVGLLRMTKMYCEETIELEDFFSQAIHKATHYRINEDVLSVFDKDEKILFTASSQKKK